MNLAIIAVSPFVALAAVCALAVLVFLVITFVQILYDVKHPGNRAEKVIHTAWCVFCLFAVASILIHAYGTVSRETLLTYLGVVIGFVLIALASISKIDVWAHRIDLWLERRSMKTQ